MTDVQRYARDCFRGVTSDRLGVELEFLVFDADNPMLPVPIARIAGALPTLTGGSRVTFEPGGQLELSAPPDVLPVAVARLTADVDAVRLALARAGLRLGGRGLDTLRPAVRQLREPRYEAMAAFLERPHGLTMMCSTASIQVNLDFGADPRARWERAHALGPVLVAAFANSPFDGWASGRQAVWGRLDPSRTAPVARDFDGRGDPVGDWARYLLDARLMLVRGPAGSGRCSTARRSATSRAWPGGLPARPTSPTTPPRSSRPYGPGAGWRCATSTRRGPPSGPCAWPSSTRSSPTTGPPRSPWRRPGRSPTDGRTPPVSVSPTPACAGRPRPASAPPPRPCPASGPSPRWSPGSARSPLGTSSPADHAAADQMEEILA